MRLEPDECEYRGFIAVASTKGTTTGRPWWNMGSNTEGYDREVVDIIDGSNDVLIGTNMKMRLNRRRHYVPRWAGYRRSIRSIEVIGIWFSSWILKDGAMWIGIISLFLNIPRNYDYRNQLAEWLNGLLSIEWVSIHMTGTVRGRSSPGGQGYVVQPCGTYSCSKARRAKAWVIYHHHRDSNDQWDVNEQRRIKIDSECSPSEGIMNQTELTRMDRWRLHSSVMMITSNDMIPFQFIRNLLETQRKIPLWVAGLPHYTWLVLEGMEFHDLLSEQPCRIIMALMILGPYLKQDLNFWNLALTGRAKQGYGELKRNTLLKRDGMA